jgi:excinuclease ABC subunit C
MLETPVAPLKGAALIKDEVKRLPDRPGVYRMVGEDGEVLYVGKARRGASTPSASPTWST